jgi:diacylglycerol kinase family enzyme
VRATLFVNPRSGKGGPSVDELASAARERGARVHVLGKHESLEELVREADADVLGMAGGDGSLGVVAAAAIERDVPFLCVPWGTRNHFAGDAGLDIDDPLGALEPLRGGRERRVDVGRVGDRVFLNNVSLGVYARVVHRRERGRRRGEALARLRALLRSLPEHRRSERFVVDGRPVRASVLLVGNNEYRLDLLSLGERERLDEGLLTIYAARGLRRLEWTERRAERVRIESPSDRLRAALDGEPANLHPPLELRIDPGALRLLVPEAGHAAST